jgi:hypothetical protein
MLRFHPAYPTTAEQNEEEIALLDAKILAASSKRDYEAAHRLQRDLDSCLQVREYLSGQRVSAAKESKLRQLEEQERQEEASIRRYFEARMSDLTQLGTARLAEIEVWHDNKLAQLDHRFSNPRFAAVRVSPDVQWLVRAETWYAERRNFKCANGYKQMATLRAQIEMERIDENADRVVAAAVAAVERRYRQCRASVQMKIGNEKIRLRRAATIAIQAMKNKHMKLRRRVLSSTDFDPVPVDEGATIYSALDEAYASFVRTIMEEPIAPSETRSPRKYPKTAQKPGSAGGRSPRVARALERNGHLFRTV